MKRLVVLGLFAACTTTPGPAPSTLLPRLDVIADQTELFIGVAFEDDKHVADVEVTFRGHTLDIGRPGEHAYASSAVLELDHPLQADEPLTVTVDGIAMTLDPPPPFDGLVVPQFISRSGSATISWATASAEPVLWFTDSSACVRGGGMTGPNATGVTFDSTNWLPPNTAPSSATCTTDLALVRERMGAVDPAFQGGQTLIDQRCDVAFASTP